MLALMLYAEARRAARRDADRRLCAARAAGHKPLGRLADRRSPKHCCARPTRGGPTGRYQIEAAIQSAHAARRLDRRRELAGDRRALRSSAGADPLAGGGPQPRRRRWPRSTARDAALAALAPLAADKRMQSYQPYWAARGHLLARAGRQGRGARGLHPRHRPRHRRRRSALSAADNSRRCRTLEPC